MNEIKPLAYRLLRFIILYGGLLYLYQKYLDFCPKNKMDPYSESIAEIANNILIKLGYTSQLIYSAEKNGLYFYTNQKYITVMIEGCNALSVMMLFLAFVFAFYSGFKKTFLFCLSGLGIIYLVNLFRIVVLNLIILHYPKQMTIAHDLFFPAIIYGIVVVLWLVWMKYYVKK